MEQENRPKIKKLIRSYKGKLSQNQSQIRNTRKVIVRQDIDIHECNNKIFVNYTLEQYAHFQYRKFQPPIFQLHVHYFSYMSNFYYFCYIQSFWLHVVISLVEIFLNEWGYNLDRLYIITKFTFSLGKIKTLMNNFLISNPKKEMFTIQFMNQFHDHSNCILQQNFWHIDQN